MKRWFTLCLILGLGGVLAYTSLPGGEPQVSAQDECAVTMTDEGITNDILTTADLTLPEAGTLCITGRVDATADIANAGPYFRGQDNVEKIFKIEVDEPTVVAFSVTFTDPNADIDAFLVRPPADAPDFATEADMIDSSEGLGSGFSPESIPPRLLLPGVTYFYGVSNFECETCGADGGPFVSASTDYEVRITVGGNRSDVSIEAGPLTFPGNILGRFTSGNGRLQVNRFSIGEALGLGAGKQGTTVRVVGFRYVMGLPEDFGIDRANPVGDYADFVAFSGPAGVARPPDNPSDVVTRRFTIPGAGLVTFFTVPLDPPIEVDASNEVFAGYFLDFREPGEGNFNWGRNQIVFWRFANEGTVERSWFTMSTGAEPVLSGWRLESFSSGGITGMGPMAFRLIVEVPGMAGALSISPDGTTERVDKLTSTKLIAQ